MKMMSDVEREVDVIRDSLYAETKNMSFSERTAYFRALAEDARRQYGITTEIILSGSMSVHR
jgi:hypothetical protein